MSRISQLGDVTRRQTQSNWPYTYSEVYNDHVPDLFAAGVGGALRGSMASRSQSREVGCCPTRGRRNSSPRQQT